MPRTQLAHPSPEMLPDRDRGPTTDGAAGGDRERRKRARTDGLHDTLYALDPDARTRLERAQRASQVAAAMREVRASGRVVEEIEAGAERFIKVGAEVMSEVAFLDYHAQLTADPGWTPEQIQAVGDAYFAWIRDEFVIYGYANRALHRSQAAPARDRASATSRQVADDAQGIVAMAQVMGVVLTVMTAAAGDLPALALDALGRGGEMAHGLLANVPGKVPAWAREIVQHALVDQANQRRFFDQRAVPLAVRPTVRGAIAQAAREL